jgi:hypothetical protein
MPRETAVFRLIVAFAMAVVAQTITSGQMPAGLASTMWCSAAATQKSSPSVSAREAAPIISPEVLLDSLFIAANDFQDEPLKIKTQMRIADLLWTHDQVRSRKRFLDTYEAINNLRQDDQKSAFQQFLSRVQLRSNLFALLGRHDRKLADHLLQESLKRDAAEVIPGVTTADRQAVERMKVADASMLFDPESASKMLSSTAATVDWRGLAGRIFAGTLNNLRQQDAAVADDVLLQALSAAQGKPSTDFNSLSNLVECMWPIRRDQADAQGPEIIRQFLTMAQPIILGKPDEQGPFITRSDNPLPDWRQMLLALYDEYTPEVAPLIHNKLSFVPPMDGLHSAWWNSEGDNVRLYRDETKTAVTDREKDSIYANSARLFAGQGLIEDAFAAVRSIGNERFRGLMETAVRQYAVEQAAKREDARSAYQYAKEEPTEARVHMVHHDH